MLEENQIRCHRYSLITPASEISASALNEFRQVERRAKAYQLVSLLYSSEHIRRPMANRRWWSEGRCSHFSSPGLWPVIDAYDCGKHPEMPTEVSLQFVALRSRILCNCNGVP
jgi:hypothetical protein